MQDFRNSRLRRNAHSPMNPRGTATRSSMNRTTAARASAHDPAYGLNLGQRCDLSSRRLGDQRIRRLESGQNAREQAGDGNPIPAVCRIDLGRPAPYPAIVRPPSGIGLPCL
jgi:hypothetical protein